MNSRRQNAGRVRHAGNILAAALVLFAIPGAPAQHPAPTAPAPHPAVPVAPQRFADSTGGYTPNGGLQNGSSSPTYRAPQSYPAPAVPARPNQAPFGQQPQGQAQVRGPHLPEWMAHHHDMPPAQQEQALRSEPGFSRLSPDKQQHLIDRLHKLDSAPPQVRQRILARNEIFERMPPEQKQNVRWASQSLSQMPPDRNMAVRHAFHDLRSLSPDQRQNVLNSARFQAEFSPQERTVLGHLLSIEPY